LIELKALNPEDQLGATPEGPSRSASGSDIVPPRDCAREASVAGIYHVARDVCDLASFQPEVGAVFVVSLTALAVMFLIRSVRRFLTSKLYRVSDQTVDDDGGGCVHEN
jgi:hypothetical protein